MIKKSITIKLFLFIVFLFILQLLIQYSFQNFFVSDFYEKEKVNEIISIFETAIEDFHDAKTLDGQVTALEEFIDNAGEPILVLNDFYDYHDASFKTSFERILFVMSNEIEYSLPLDEIYDPNTSYYVFDPAILGDVISIIGYADNKLANEKWKEYNSLLQEYIGEYGDEEFDVSAFEEEMEYLEEYDLNPEVIKELEKLFDEAMSLVDSDLADEKWEEYDSLLEKYIGDYVYEYIEASTFEDEMEFLEEYELSVEVLNELEEIFEEAKSLEDDSIFFPIGIETDAGLIYTSTIEEEDEFIAKDYDLVAQEGVILDYEEMQISNEMLTKLDALENNFYDEHSIEDTSLYKFLTDSKYVNGEKLHFLTLVSLQPINEVLAIQSKFQSYLFIGMILLALLVAFILSKIISKPIIEVSEVAGQIANLNFEASCDESRTDEIGILGSRINHLSDSLESKIDDLERTNNQLEDDILFERRQDKIRKEFVADVSHELKTPLGVIKSYSEGIVDGILKEKQTYYLDVIVEEVNKMNLLISDMLQLSNLESDVLKMNYEEINLKRMLQNLLRPYENVIESQQIDFKFDSLDVILNVDIRKMESALSNLLSNAFRYVDDSNIINITLTKYNLIIENSHSKIDDDELSKLWNRFHRVEKSRMKSLGGNGLGLSIVKNILDRHDFKYDIESNEKSFIFIITFN